ncbi:lysophospholipid acyltransferase family protein [Larsenimonas salina]|uniref:lysophospholipid acyltransferase family protein n=1 Tax=Larsenimonas salina TaxID=1295565 RepID=UPI002073F109|nr:lysophospholipid acyltransferase family protein [Larsenimonas salina]MCM5704968.1 lysophospholipid acyltransferase family protein [Larsenimonas salina]
MTDSHTVSLKARLQARLIHGLWNALARWRPHTLWRLSRCLEPLYRTLAPRERRVTRVNLKAAYPDMDKATHRRLTRDSLTHSIATIMELGFAWIGEAGKVETAIHAVHGRELLDDARASGRGVIVLAPHFGNWEVLNFWLSSHFPFTAMYEPPKIAPLDPVIRTGRERKGAALVPTNSRGVAALLKALKRCEAVGILPDQVPSWGSGVFADFFGRPAYTATLLPKLVARTDARVVVGVACRKTDTTGGFEIHFLRADERVYDPDETVSAAGVNACVEAAIALDPAQYQWEYKRFRRTPGQQENAPGWQKQRLYGDKHR